MGTGKAQSGLGYLFVDIGIGGAAKAIKTLNSISASFLLTKNSAQQVLKPFVDIGKEALNNSVQIGKMNAMFGFTMQEYQKLVRYFKDHSVSESLIGDLTKMSDQLTKFHKDHINTFSQEQIWAATQLGIEDITKYTGSMEDMLELTSRLQAGVKRLDTNTARMRLSQLGYSPEWLWAFRQQNFDIRDAKTLSDAEVNAGIDLQNKINETINDIHTILQKALLDNAPQITKFLENAVPAAARLLEWLNKHLPKQEKESKEDAINRRLARDVKSYDEGAALYHSYKEFGYSDRDLERKYGKEFVQMYKGSMNPSVPIPGLESCVPTNKTNINNITINNNNQIDANNPEDIAKAIGGMTQMDILKGQFRIQEMLDK